MCEAYANTWGLDTLRLVLTYTSRVALSGTDRHPVGAIVLVSRQLSRSVRSKKRTKLCVVRPL